MSDHRQPDGEHELHLEHYKHPGVYYESRDLGARGIVGFLIALALAGIVIHFVVWGILRYYSRFSIQTTPPITGERLVTTPKKELISGDPSQRFPKPALQPDPVADLNRFRADNEATLNSYDWVDQESGVARVPIERAIDLMSQRGLPVRPQPQLAPRAEFGSGDDSIPGAGAGTNPRSSR